MSFCRVITKKSTLSGHEEARNRESPTKELIARTASREEPEGTFLSYTKVHSQQFWPSAMRPFLPTAALISKVAIQDSSVKLSPTEPILSSFITFIGSEQHLDKSNSEPMMPPVPDVPLSNLPASLPSPGGPSKPKKSKNSQEKLKVQKEVLVSLAYSIQG